MKPVKIAMVSLTHGHTRKYYQTLRENSKLDWVASCAEDERAKEEYMEYLELAKEHCSYYDEDGNLKENNVIR